MLTLNEMRMIVTNNMPYDTGFMFMSGSRYQENAHFMVAKYDTERVPYIVYNEEGTVYSTKNQYFIREQTVGDSMRHANYKDAGMQAPFTKLSENVKRRSSTNLLKQGAIDKIRSEAR